MSGDLIAVSGRAAAVRAPGKAEAARFAASAALYAASVAAYLWFTLTYKGLWTHTDEYAYWSAGRLAVLHSADIYNVNFPPPGSHSNVPFIYPPFTAAILALLSPASFAVWQAALVAANLIAVPVSAFLASRIGGRRGMRAWAPALALSSLAIWLQPVYLTNFFGQVNLLLLVLVMADLALPDSSRWKGAGIGVAAGIKLTPLIFAPFLLASRRVRAGLVSAAAFAGTVALGWVLMPAASREYWGGKFASPAVGPGRQQNQSLYGVALRIFHHQAAAHAPWLAAAALIGIAGLAVAVAASRRGMELPGIVTCAVTGLLVSEISWTHHWVWVVPALAVAWGGSPAGRRQMGVRITATAVIAAVFFQWVVPYEMWPALPHWDGVVFADSHDLFVIAGLLAIAGAAGYLRVTREPGSGSFRGAGRARARRDDGSA